MYRKPKIEDSLAKNIFLGSKMDFCMADVTSERVNEYIWKGQVSRTTWPEKNSVCSNMDFLQDDITFEDISLNVLY